MKKIRGFKLGAGKLFKVFKWKIRPGSRRYYRKSTGNNDPLTRISSFARFLQRGIKGLCNSNSGSDSSYIRLGENGTKRVTVPKGHLVVHVGESETDTRKVVVPVIYFNHPLFEELLKDSERVYGFNQSGCITLPCGISEFEKIKTRIADWENCRREKYSRC